MCGAGPRWGPFAQGPSGAWPAAACALRAASGPARAARPPLRGPRSGPLGRRAFSALPGAGPPLPPPRSAARPVCAAVRLRGRSLPPSALGPARPVLRASGAALWAPLLRLGLARVQRVGRGGSAAGPLRGFGPGGLRAPAPRSGPLARFLFRGGPGLWLRARACPRLPSGSWCAAAAAALLGLAWLLWLCFALAGARHRRSPRRAASGDRVRFSPAPLPSPPPPLGAPGKREASGLGVPAPPLARLPSVSGCFPGNRRRAGFICGHLPEIRPRFAAPAALSLSAAPQGCPPAAPVAPGLDPLRAGFVRRA